MRRSTPPTCDGGVSLVPPFGAVPVRDERGHLVTGMSRDRRRGPQRAERPCSGAGPVGRGETRARMIADGEALPRVWRPCAGWSRRSSDMLACLVARCDGTHPAARRGAPPAARVHQHHRQRRHWPTGVRASPPRPRRAGGGSDIAVDRLWAEYRHLPWRAACAPAGPRRSCPPKARCSAPSRSTLASPAPKSA